ncbi:MAG: hypothetical protein V4677_16860 [Bacteroidota bacterium]
MLDLQLIKEKYQAMLTDDLIRLSKKPKDLREEVIPVLKAELIRRGKRDDAAVVDQILEETQKLKYQGLSLVELREIVRERLDAGEEMESIKIDFRLNGIDVFELLKEEVKFEEEVFGSITQMKQEGASVTDIDDHLEKTYQIDKADTSKLRSELIVKGKRNQTWGFVLIMISCVFLLIMCLNDSTHGLKAYGLMLISGISMYALGVKQAKD